MALTATRPGEVRFADWSEFDLDASLWTIPAARTKTAADLRIPLPLRAVSVVRMAGTFTRRRTGLVFPSPATGAALSDNTWRKLLADLGINCTSHGFRSSFRSWCSDTGVPRDLAEMALGHAVRDRTEAVYARSDMLERRRPLMDTWADHIGWLAEMNATRLGVDNSLYLVLHTGPLAETR